MEIFGGKPLSSSGLLLPAEEEEEDIGTYSHELVGFPGGEWGGAAGGWGEPDPRRAWPVPQPPPDPVCVPAPVLSANNKYLSLASDPLR